MNTFKLETRIAANSPLEAQMKKRTLESLSQKFGLKVLQALDNKGESFINHPVYGPTVRGFLDLE